MLGEAKPVRAWRPPAVAGMIALLGLGSFAALCLSSLAASADAGSRASSATHLSVPTSARQLIVVSSPGHDPHDFLARFQSFQRSSASSPWTAVFPSWQAEIGSGELRDMRREGDHATPTGVYPLGATIYGNQPDPGGLHEPYHHLVCGDWWDEDPYSLQYSRFVHVPCGSTPPFAAYSEALWTETMPYPYFAVIEYNEHPVISGPEAPGSGIFLHAWVDGPTEGCVALHLADLLDVLRWLNPADHPVIEIGTSAEVGQVPPAPQAPAATPPEMGAEAESGTTGAGGVGAGGS